jgi:hypothetical protein
MLALPSVPCFAADEVTRADLPTIELIGRRRVPGPLAGC